MYTKDLKSPGGKKKKKRKRNIGNILGSHKLESMTMIQYSLFK